MGENEKDAWAKLKTLWQSNKEIQTIDKLNKQYWYCLRAMGLISDAFIIVEYWNTINKNIKPTILGTSNETYDTSIMANTSSRCRWDGKADIYKPLVPTLYSPEPYSYSL